MNASENKPPVFQTWNAWYRLLMIVTLIQLLVYFWITRSLNV